MRPLSLVVLFALTLFVNCMPTENVEADRADIIETLMPTFGKIKIKSIVSARTIEFIRRFFDLNPKYYQSFRDGLEKENIFLPDFADLKWNVIQQQDFDDLKALIGEASFADAVQQEFLDDLKNKIESDPALIARLESRVDDAGVTYIEPIDIDSVGNTLSKAFKPMMIAFTPIAMQILWFGKREIVDERLPANLQSLFQQAQQFLASHPQIYALVNQHLAQLGIQLPKGDLDNIINVIVTQILPILPSIISLFGKRDLSQIAQFIPINQIQQLLSSGQLQSLIQQAQQFLATNPQIYNFINQQLAQFGIQLPKIDINWQQFIIPVVTSLISLIGKRDISQIAQFLPINQIQQLLSSGQLQSILQQAQQFLASNPQIYNFINQQLAQFGIQLPRIELNEIINVVIQVLPSLISLFGKRDVSAVLPVYQFQNLLQQIQQMLQSMGIDLPKNLDLGSIVNIILPLVINLFGK